VSDVTARWRSARVMATVYDAGVNHERVANSRRLGDVGADRRWRFADIGRLALQGGRYVAAVTFERSGAVEFFEARLPLREGAEC
jgi:hypothetical protein